MPPGWRRYEKRLPLYFAILKKMPAPGPPTSPTTTIHFSPRPRGEWRDEGVRDLPCLRPVARQDARAGRAQQRWARPNAVRPYNPCPPLARAVIGLAPSLHWTVRMGLRPMRTVQKRGAHMPWDGHPARERDMARMAMPRRVGVGLVPTHLGGRIDLPPGTHEGHWR